MWNQLTIFFSFVPLPWRYGQCFSLKQISLGCSRSLFLIFVSNGLVPGVVVKGGFGIFGFWLFGPYGWMGIVGFLIITRNPLIRCIGELGIDAFGGLWFVKNLLIGPFWISSCHGLPLYILSASLFVFWWGLAFFLPWGCLNPHNEIFLYKKKNLYNICSLYLAVCLACLNISLSLYFFGW